MKTCRDCKQQKAAEDFNQLKSARDGLNYYCRDCSRSRGRVDYNNNKAARSAWRNKWRRDNVERFARSCKNWALQRKYGMTLAEFEALLHSQGKSCLICGASARQFHVDHSHKTGVVRGILCVNCNVGLGAFSDSAEVLRKAAAYLEAR